MWSREMGMTEIPSTSAHAVDQSVLMEIWLSWAHYIETEVA
ncbi:MAG TPA: hypothetical protein VMA75_03370 [Candidatus Paceibacterota bacterium]|nr:hypothetical protein [Candidatus Paceibacterota bacterium]